MTESPGSPPARRSLALAERGWIPDPLLRRGIRHMLADRLREQSAGGCEAQLRRQRAFLAALRASPVALLPEKANQQHYEVPPELFRLVLGPRLKYSACLFPPGVRDLAAAEEHMLRLTCERARLEDGMRILELGCGWGSLALWIAEHLPNATLLAVSNSKRQREHIVARADRLGLRNVEVVTADMNVFDTARRFDRVVSVEMFEHMRNWGLLLHRIAGWLEPDGRAFLHFFCHREMAYPYEPRGAGDWMARHFFSGGMMPSDGLIESFQDDLVVEERWRVAGTHYQQTCEAWLRNLDASHEAVLPLLEGTADVPAERAFRRWRLFFLACAELFGYRGGNEWFVSHCRLAPRSASAR